MRIKRQQISVNPHSVIYIPQFFIVRASVQSYLPQFASREWSERRAVVTWLLVVSGAFAWMGLLASAPVLWARGHEFFAGVVYQSFGVVCHQLPARSFYLDGHPLAVCARCFGIYSGFTLCALLYPLVRPLRRTQPPARLWLAAGALPTMIDFLLGYTGIWTNTHLSRFVTGALLGATAVFYILPGLVDIGQCGWRHLCSRSTLTKQNP